MPCAFAADALPDTLGAPVSLTLALTGTITNRCGFAATPSTAAALGDLAVTGSLALPFVLDCNVPFDVKVVSSNGALSRVTPITTPAEFVSRLDYTIGVSVATDLAPVAAQCSVSALTVPGCPLGTGLSSGDGVGIGTSGALTLSWAPPAQKLVAGSYQDQITLTVEVRA